MKWAIRVRALVSRHGHTAINWIGWLIVLFFPVCASMVCFGDAILWCSIGIDVFPVAAIRISTTSFRYVIVTSTLFGFLSDTIEYRAYVQLCEVPMTYNPLHKVENSIFRKDFFFHFRCQSRRNVQSC